VNFSDPFGLRVCFQGRGYQRLADSTGAATGTSFTLDAAHCAQNVQPTSGQWDAVSSGFAALAGDTVFTWNMQYGSGGSRNDASGITIDQSQIGQLYGTVFVRRGYCQAPPNAIWDEPSIIAHELGHAYAWYTNLSGGAGNRMAVDWENRIHGARGRPLRNQLCHVR
jgi:hypothetical protein